MLPSPWGVLVHRLKAYGRIGVGNVTLELSQGETGTEVRMHRSDSYASLIIR